MEEALEHAIKHPIGRFIREPASVVSAWDRTHYQAPWMTLEAVRERHRGLVERDWRSVAEDYFAREYKDGKVSAAWRTSKCPGSLTGSHHFYYDLMTH